ncbi:O-antigen ligase family protein [Plantibacter sp. YIM 135347]|uniref:O-antigen ligase family protein n=1 Tax=Plantibacter sp. YIM 135347 TaxID=3423919 RepID=UPI003D34829A
MKGATHDLIVRAQDFFSSAPLAAAFTTITLGVAFAYRFIINLIGEAGYVAMLAGLVVIAVVVLVARLPIIEWRGVLPISLLLFLAWCAASVAWSVYPLGTIPAVAEQLSWAFLAIVVALIRDTIQVVRAVGNVLRALLGLSLAIEILSGVLIDMPIRFLGVHGDLASGGPLQGIFGSRNALGLVALLAIVTFVVEWRTRSVTVGVTIGSLALAAGLALGTRSPTMALVAVALAAATGVLYVLRQLQPEPRRKWQFVLLVVVVLLGLGVYVFRAQLFALLGVGGEIEQRYELWQVMLNGTADNALNGWGWAGPWISDQPPYSVFDMMTGHENPSGLNAYLDVYLQVGLIGLVLFVVLCTLALGRAWLIASNRRSVVFVWAPLVLVVLLASAAAESRLLVHSGWLLLVICAVQAAHGLSWRRKLPER